MRYWCERYATGIGYVDGTYIYGMGYRYGYGDFWIYDNDYSPSMLVTGVKLEEVVLNAILV